MGRNSKPTLRWLAGVCAVALAAGTFAAPKAHAALDKVRVGKAVPFAFIFIPVDVGKAAGIWARYGIDLTSMGFGGAAKVQQALAAGDIDFGLDSGPGMAFAVKGVPAKAVAAFYGPPADLSLIIPYNSPIKSVADLKGKMIGVTTAGSLTDWLAKRLSVTQGWGPHGIATVPLGGMQPMLAAMKTKQVDGIFTATEVGYALQAKKIGKNLVNAATYVPHFITHVIIARDELIQKNPALVQRFVNGFFATLAYMKTHKKETVDVAVKVLHQPRVVESRAYDAEVKYLTTNGVFKADNLPLLKKSLVEMGMLHTEPTDAQMFTTQFVPAKP